jgi:hypothetical protein
MRVAAVVLVNTLLLLALIRALGLSWEFFRAELMRFRGGAR